MNGIELPRGRFTDALIALSAFILLFVALAVGLVEAALRFGFVPAAVVGGETWRMAVSPLASAFVPLDILSQVFNAVFLLIAGRFVEKAIGRFGLAAVFVLGAYAGAVARLLLTPGSPLPSAGLAPALFAVVGAYLMLYGVPQMLPVPRHLPRAAQIGALALFWLAVQLVFSLVAGGLELSVSLIDPIGGLVAGIFLARPLMAWRYRKA